MDKILVESGEVRSAIEEVTENTFWERVFKTRVTVALYLGALVVFVFGFSYFVLSKQSLRLDEAQSLWQTSRTPFEILRIIAQDVHVPLYHMILHLVQAFFGNSVETARMLSTIFFIIAIPFFYMLALEALGKRVAMLSTLFLALSSFMNWYANEIRMYTLLTLLTILSQYLFILIFKKPNSLVWFLYGLVSVLGVYTHYFFAFTLVTQAVFYLFHRGLFKKGLLTRFVFVACTVGVCFLPWLLFVYSLGSASNTKPLLHEPTIIDLFNTYSQFIFGFQSSHINTILLSLWPLVVILGFLALNKSRKFPAEISYFILSAFFPVLMAFGLSLLVRPFFVSRYLIISLPSLIIVISWLISMYPKKLSYILQTIFVAGLGITLYAQTITAGSPVKENYKQAAAYISEQSKPQDIVLVTAPFTIYPVEYYYSGEASLSTLPFWNRQNSFIPEYSPELIDKEVQQIKNSYRNVYVLFSYDQGYEQEIREYMDQRFERTEEKKFSEGLSLYVYRFRYDNSMTL